MPIIGDFAGDLTGHKTAGSQILTGIDPQYGGFFGFVYGDMTGSISGHSVGGDDKIASSAARTFLAYGDATIMSGHAKGGDDEIIGGSRSPSIYGDAQQMIDHARGGDDDVTANIVDNGRIYGDAEVLSGQARGGDDFLVLNSSISSVGDGRSIAYGDGKLLANKSRGGDDIITSTGTGNGNDLYGDALELRDQSRGGDDRLISGRGADRMWGDAAIIDPKAHGGSDTFVFEGRFGNDEIHDFRPSEGDRLEIDIINPASPSAEVACTVNSANNTIIITVDGGESSGTITLRNFTGNLDGYIIFT